MSGAEIGGTPLADFLGMPASELPEIEPAVQVWPIPYEATTSYAQGTAAGPAAILAASEQVELWDEELDSEPYLAGIETLSAFTAQGSHEANMNSLQLAAAAHLQTNRFLLALGGEHSITIPLVRAQAARHPGLSVLQFDAHSDLRQAYEGSDQNHACVMARVQEVCPYVGIGIRSGIRGERESLRADALLLYAHEMRADSGWPERVLSALTDKVYITFDLDFFDPSIMPATGTPEPGGFLWRETLRFLRRVFREKQVVGADIVELMPVRGLHHADFLAARLAYKMLGYRTENT